MDLAKIEKRKILDYSLLAIYAVITLLVIVKHEPWRDEAQTWLLAKNAGFFELFFQELRAQQHPFLWYLILFPFAKIGLPYFAQSFLHWILAIAGVSLFVCKAPLPRITRYSFLFSYLMIHEYVIIARHYNCGIFLLFLLACLYPFRFKKPILFGGVVFFLFNSTYLLFTLAVTLTGLYAWESKKQGLTKRDRNISLSLMVLGGVISFANAVLLPYNHIDKGFGHIFDLNNVLVAIGKAFIPVTWDVAQWLSIALGIIIILASIVYFLRKPVGLLMLLGGYLGIFYIFAFRYPGYLRSIGFLLIILLFSFWVSSYYEERDWSKSRNKLFLPKYFVQCRQIALTLITLTLLLSVKYGVWANQMEMKALFSGSKSMAVAISKISEKFQLAHEPIIAHPATNSASVAAYLPLRKFWYADLQNYGTFWRHIKELDRKEELSHEEIISRSIKKFGNLSSVFLLLSKPLNFKRTHGYDFKLLYSVDKGVWGYGLERYYLYKPILQIN